MIGSIVIEFPASHNVIFRSAFLCDHDVMIFNLIFIIFLIIMIFNLIFIIFPIIFFCSSYCELQWQIE